MVFSDSHAMPQTKNVDSVDRAAKRSPKAKALPGESPAAKRSKRGQLAETAVSVSDGHETAASNSGVEGIEAAVKPESSSFLTPKKNPGAEIHKKKTCKDSHVDVSAAKVMRSGARAGMQKFGKVLLGSPDAQAAANQTSCATALALHTMDVPETLGTDWRSYLGSCGCRRSISRWMMTLGMLPQICAQSWH